MCKCSLCGVRFVLDRAFGIPPYGLCPCCEQKMTRPALKPPSKGWWFGLREHGTDCVILYDGQMISDISKVTICAEADKPARAVVEICDVQVHAAVEGDAVEIRR